MSTVTLGIMTHNEIQEFHWLMEEIDKRRDYFREVLVIDDFSSDEMISEIRSHDVSLHQRALNKNFAAQRNYLFAQCKSEFLFIMDADEIPAPSLIEALPRITKIMRSKDIDIVLVPRLNVVHEEQHPIDARTLSFSSSGPFEPIPRIIRKAPYLKFIHRKHERFAGIRRRARLPDELEYCIFHVKSRARCLQQWAFYRTIGRYDPGFVAKRLGLTPLAKRFAKPLGLMPEADLLDSIELGNTPAS